MKKGFFIFLLIIFSIPTFAAKFYTCKSKYALCTTAKCVPIAGKKNLVSCRCNVKTGYSVGEKQCQAVKETGKRELIYSRYYPIKRYVVCENKRPWAWCLDKPCFIDKKNPSKASCACNTVSDLGSYIIVTDKNTATTCTKGIISSATLDQSAEITNYLKTQKNLKPFPIKVLH